MIGKTNIFVGVNKDGKERSVRGEGTSRQRGAGKQMSSLADVQFEGYSTKERKWTKWKKRETKKERDRKSKLNLSKRDSLMMMLLSRLITRIFLSPRSGLSCCCLFKGMFPTEETQDEEESFLTWFSRIRFSLVSGYSAPAGAAFRRWEASELLVDASLFVRLPHRQLKTAAEESSAAGRDEERERDRCFWVKSWCDDCTKRRRSLKGREKERLRE